MQSSNVENKILARIKKMLALANCEGATEQERDTAMTMAQNLLAKHNLSMTDLPPDSHTEAREQQQFTMCGDIWMRGLAGSVAKLYFCSYYFMRVASCKDTHVFFGKQSNVVTAQYMAEFLLKSVKREASRRYKSPTSPEGRSFCVGATEVIRRRIFNMMRSDTTNDSGQPIPGTALMLANAYAAEDVANKAALALVVELKKTKPRASSVVSDAYGSGKDFGRTVGLNTQVGTSSVKRTAIGN